MADTPQASASATSGAPSPGISWRAVRPSSWPRGTNQAQALVTSSDLAHADAGRIEAPGGDLQQFGLGGELLDLDRARAAITAKAAA